MARAYSGVLGAMALVLCILRGLVIGMLPNEILSQSLMVFCVFAGVGYGIGFIAERTVDESVENRFREEVARRQSLHGGGSESSDK